MASTNGSKAATIALWALKIVVGLVFLAAAAAKLLGAPMMVQEFGVVGLGQWFRLFTGLVEVSGVVLLLLPKTSRFGASLLFCVCLGALAAQTLRIHQDVVHVFVLMALTGFLTWTGWRAAETAGLSVAKA